MSHRWVFAALALTPAAIVLPAHATVYMTAEASRTVLFPQATHFDAITLDTTPAQQAALDQALGVATKPRRVQGWAARDESGKLLGHVLVDEVLGKYELITYAVAFAASGEIKGVEVLAYRESHGQEIRLPSWRNQFVGKKAVADLSFGSGIKGISGATLSCRHVTEGIQRLSVLYTQVIAPR